MLETLDYIAAIIYRTIVLAAAVMSLWIGGALICAAVSLPVPEER